MRMKDLCAALVVAGLLGAASTAFADDMKLPPLKRQKSAQAVVAEHLDALNQCDWNRLMAQYPPQVEIHLPDGVVVKGRQKVGELFAGFCKTRADKGLKGLKFSTQTSFAVGGTLNVLWHADADFLAETYKGSDAYVTKDGLMYAQVTTFDGTKLKFKP
jgi:ketosteroid isomerase-like protein